MESRKRNAIGDEVDGKRPRYRDDEEDDSPLSEDETASEGETLSDVTSEYTETETSSETETETSDDEPPVDLFTAKRVLAAAPEKRIEWNPGPYDLTPDAHAYRTYKGQLYFEERCHKSLNKEYVDMLRMKTLPAFSETYEKWLGEFEKRNEGFQTLKKASEALVCLVEKPYACVDLLTDAVWEDLQTYAHLTLVVDLYITSLMKSVVVERCLLDDRPKPLSEPISAYETKKLIEKAYGQHVKYVKHVKPYLSAEDVVRACNFRSKTSVAQTLAAWDGIKQAALGCVLYKYLEAGAPLIKAWRNTHKRLTFKTALGEDVEGDAEAELERFRTLLGAQIKQGDHRRSFRTLDLDLLPLRDMAPDEYAYLLTRQFSVGVLSPMDFRRADFLEADAKFFAFTDKVPVKRVGLIEAMCALPDPIMDRHSFARGLISSRDNFSRHSAQFRLKPPGGAGVEPPPNTQSLVKTPRCFYRCVEGKCRACVNRFLESEEFLKDETPAEELLDYLLHDLPLPRENRRTLAEDAVDYWHRGMALAKLVRFHAEAIYCGIPIAARGRGEIAPDRHAYF